MDRAQIVGVVDLANNENTAYERENQPKNNTIENIPIILVFNVDGFVMGQIPHMISTLVTMTNVWLPPNFFEIATRSDVQMPVLLAPSCLYCSCQVLL